MAGSTYGKILTMTTWGESHGAGVGVVVDGCPAGLALCEEDVQRYLDRRKPGQSRLRRSAARAIRWRSCQAFLKGGRRARRSRCWCGTRISIRRITVRSPVITVPDMQIIPSMKNTVSGITGASDVLRDARRSDAWQQALSRQSCWNPRTFG